MAVSAGIQVIDPIPLLGNWCNISMEVQVWCKPGQGGAIAAQGGRKGKQSGEVCLWDMDEFGHLLRACGRVH